jgi:DNA primase
MDEVRRLAKQGVSKGQRAKSKVSVDPALATVVLAQRPDPRDPALLSQRGVLRLMLQVPTYFTQDWCALVPEDFTHPAYRAVFSAVLATPFQSDGWGELVRDCAPEGTVRQLVLELLVEQPPREPNQDYVDAHVARVRLPRVEQAIAEARSVANRANSLGNQDIYDPSFQQWLDLMEEQGRLRAAITAGAG